MNHSDIEIKIREATSDEPWGPHSSLMQEIAQMTFKYDMYSDVMSAMWKRVFQEKESWRSIYKSLLLLAYLIRNGSEKVAFSCRDHMYDLRGLVSFSYLDEKGKDQGLNSKHFGFFLLRKVNKILNKQKQKSSIESQRDCRFARGRRQVVRGASKGAQKPRQIHRHWLVRQPHDGQQELFVATLVVVIVVSSAS